MPTLHKTDIPGERGADRSRPVSAGSAMPSPASLQGMDAESINRVLELLVDPLQAALPQPTEVLLHDLKRCPHTIRRIAGDVTRRQIGDPPTDMLLERVAVRDLAHKIGYRSQLPDGRVLQSTTIIYTDGRGDPAAALCLNTDVSAWVALRSSMDGFALGGDVRLAQLPVGVPEPGPVETSSPKDWRGEHFPQTVEELSSHLIDEAIAEVGVPRDQMRKEHKMQIVSELERRGFFLVKQAAENAARALGVTRFTIYNYLNELNGEAEESS